MRRLLTLPFGGLFCVLLVLIAVQSPAATATAPIQDRPLTVPRVQGLVLTDGRLNEPIWAEALTLTLDYEVRPAENETPPVQTEVLLAYSSTDLYVAFKAYDPEPDQIRARMRDRDAVGADDWVAINLDTFNDARRSFLLMCNPLGNQSDVIETTSGSTSWDAIWDSGGQIHDWGYAVEMRIPFSSLRFPSQDEPQTWGIDAIRSYPRSVRHHIGLFPRDRDNNCYLCQAVKVRGFAGADPGRNLEIDPTVSGILAQERDDASYGPFRDERSELDAGITGRWGITPNLMLTGTVNPDFSQVEADAAQLDVNRQFALYYDERRPFFLEGTEVFDSHRPLVYTRNVADPLWGAKLTGKEGPHGIGFFLAQDEITNLLLPGRDGSDNETLDENSLAGAARYKLDLGSNASYVGALATVRESKNGYGNRVASVDASLDLSKRDRLRLQGIGTWTEYDDYVQEEYEQDASLFGESFYTQFFHNTRAYDGWAFAGRRHPDFRADMGFISRTDVAYWGGGNDYTWYNEDSGEWWSNTFVGVDFEDIRSYDMNDRLSTEAGAWWHLNGAMQSWMHVFGELRREWYEGERYLGDNVYAGAGFRPSAAMYLDLEGGFGQQVDYSNDQPGFEWWANPEVAVAVGRHLTVSTSHNHTEFTVNDGRLFTADISRVRLVYQFTREFFVRAIVQNVYYDFNKPLYDDPDDVDDIYHKVGTQFLASYTLNPQTVVYLGYSDNIESEDRRKLAQTDRVFFFKLGYAWVL